MLQNPELSNRNADWEQERKYKNILSKNNSRTGKPLEVRTYISMLPENANTLANYVLVRTFRNMVHFRSKTVNLVIQSDPKKFFPIYFFKYYLRGKKNQIFELKCKVSVVLIRQKYKNGS